jgi:hypothetical protein
MDQMKKQVIFNLAAHLILCAKMISEQYPLTVWTLALINKCGTAYFSTL